MHARIIWQKQNDSRGTMPRLFLWHATTRIIIFHDDGSHKNAIRYAVCEYRDVFASAPSQSFQDSGGHAVES